MDIRKIKIRMIYILIFVFVIFFVYIEFISKKNLILIDNYKSPNGDYSLMVFIHNEERTYFGSERQKSGIVILLDKNGNTLQQDSCENVGLIEDVWWEKNNIIIRGYDIWSYPEKMSQTEPPKKH